jgi:glycosyltransferase involved in cell wall biosynthesis
MKRFILVDHSIRDLAGHHYEYAVHVLQAAERAGYTPILVTNRKFQQRSSVPWKVLPLYEFGFWTEARTSRATAWAKWMQRWWFLLRFHCRYSKIGLAWSAATEWGDSSTTPRDTLPMTSGTLILLIVFCRFLVLLAAAILIVPVLLLVLLWTTYAVSRFSIRVLGVLLAGRKPVITHPIAAYISALEAARKSWRSIPGAVWHKCFHRASPLSPTLAQEARQARQFAKDTARLLQTTVPEAGDLLFYPTISPRDLGSLAELSNTGTGAPQSSWHFLFRRNIYTGRKSEYGGQEQALEGLRAVFDRVHNSKLADFFYFYTDTTELTDQYERLGLFRFHTLPIPHTHSSSDCILHARPLRLTYLGDARTEKGFGLLPHLVRRLTNTCLATGKAHFIVQCNYNIPDGEPKARLARTQLELAPEFVTLYKQPLTSQAYRRLLLSSDLLLLPYDPVNYYARSSGILVESLAAGIPVIVPSGCWLARQFQDFYNKHLLNAQKEMTILEAYAWHGLPWSGPSRYREEAWLGAKRDKSHTKPPHAAILSAEHEDGPHTLLSLPHGTTHLLFSVTFTRGCHSGRIEVTEIDWRGAVGKRRMIRLDATTEHGPAVVLSSLGTNTHQVLIAIRSANAGQETWVADIQIQFLRCPADRRFPMGAVGLIYQSESEIPELIQDLIEHYPHYRSTAIEFSKCWRDYHNADHLIKEIEANVTAVPHRQVQRLAQSVL